jgi:hypothetical protein
MLPLFFHEAPSRHIWVASAEDLGDRGPAVPTQKIGMFDRCGGSLIAFGVMLFVFATFKARRCFAAGWSDVTARGEATET